jgi:rod shape-determining protein MreD
MNIGRIILVVLIVLVLQVTVIHKMAVAGAMPDLFIVALVALVLQRGPVLAVLIGFALGFLQDLGNASYLGMNALSKSLLAYGVSRLGSGLLPENVLYKGVIIFIACLLNDAIVLAITTGFSPGEMLFSFFRYSLLSAIYSALVGVCIYSFLELFPRRVVRSRGGY